MRFRMLFSALALILLTTGLASAQDKKVVEKQDKTRKMAAQTLQGSVQAPAHG